MRHLVPLARSVCLALLSVAPAPALAEEPVQLEGHSRDELSVAFSPDGKTLAMTAVLWPVPAK